MIGTRTHRHTDTRALSLSLVHLFSLLFYLCKPAWLLVVSFFFPKVMAFASDTTTDRIFCESLHRTNDEVSSSLDVTKFPTFSTDDDSKKRSRGRSPLFVILRMSRCESRGGNVMLFFGILIESSEKGVPTYKLLTFLCILGRK